MKRLVVITQRVDVNDDLLGFFVGWLRQFAKNFDRVDVITLAKGEYDLPANVSVYSLGKENGTSKIAQAFRYFWLLHQLAPNSSGVFGHMSPIFALTAWPFTKLYGKKLVLWYLHRSVTLRFKIAVWLCNAIVTSTRESLRVKSPKIIEVGHGIDMHYFKTERNWEVQQERSTRILSVGRLSPIKDYETLIRAAKLLKDRNINFNVTIVGRPVMHADYKYQRRLTELARELEVTNEVELAGFVPYSRIAPHYGQADIVVGLAPTGGIDKTILEGMASGALILTANQAFAKYLPDNGRDLIFEHGDAEGLARHMERLIRLSVDEKKALSRALSASIEKHHNLENAIRAISRLY